MNFSSPTFLGALGIISILDFGHSSTCIRGSHFNLNFSYEIGYEESFHIIVYAFFFFDKLSSYVFPIFFNHVGFFIEF